MKKNFGVELLLDMHGCNIDTFTEENITTYFKKLCECIEMERQGEPVFWVEYGEELHMSGISAVQFIRTSNIVIHTLDKLQSVYINIFSCKHFDSESAITFTQDFFGATDMSFKFIDRVWNEKEYLFIIKQSIEIVLFDTNYDPTVS